MPEDRDPGQPSLTQSGPIAMRDRYLRQALDTDDDQALIAQVSSRGFYYVNDSRIALESKRSSTLPMDEADALAMTFAAGRREVRIWV